jgi:hypothetical protein
VPGKKRASIGHRTAENFYSRQFAQSYIMVCLRLFTSTIHAMKGHSMTAEQQQPTFLELYLQGAVFMLEDADILSAADRAILTNKGK